MKQNLITVIRFLLILLFIYAAFSKLLIVNTFQQQLAQSPLIPPSIITILAYIVPIFEISIALLLIIEQFALWGLFLSTLTMFFFSLYLIALVQFFPSNLPCACGGILNKLGYTEHITFNIIFTLLASYGLIYFKPQSSNEI